MAQALRDVLAELDVNPVIVNEGGAIAVDALVVGGFERKIVQKLKIYQSLWGMELRDPRRPERSKAETFSMIAAAGFDGACIDPVGRRDSRVPRLRTPVRPARPRLHGERVSLCAGRHGSDHRLRG